MGMIMTIVLIVVKISLVYSLPDTASNAFCLLLLILTLFGKAVLFNFCLTDDEPET